MGKAIQSLSTLAGKTAGLFAKPAEILPDEKTFVIPKTELLSALLILGNVRYTVEKNGLSAKSGF
jgi:hypothetical protein